MDTKKIKYQDWIKILIFVLFIVISFWWAIRSTINNKIQHANQIENMLGNIYFSGKVVAFHHVKHSGMPSAAIMCIKIDSSNVDSFYQFDEYIALKIKNGIVTFPIGSFSETTEDTVYEKTIYAIVNEAASHKMIFVIKGNDTITEDLYFTSADLKEYDLNICDDCY